AQGPGAVRGINTNGGGIEHYTVEAVAAVLPGQSQAAALQFTAEHGSSHLAFDSSTALQHTGKTGSELCRLADVQGPVEVKRRLQRTREREGVHAAGKLQVDHIRL